MDVGGESGGGEMKIHIKINVYAGKYTETSVEAYSTTAKPRTITLKNGVKLKDKEIVRWIEKSLLEAVQKLGGEVEQ